MRTHTYSRIFEYSLALEDRDRSLVRDRLSQWLQANGLNERCKFDEMVFHFLQKKGVKENEIEISMHGGPPSNVVLFVVIPVNGIPLEDAIKRLNRMQSTLVDCVGMALKELGKLGK